MSDYTTDLFTRDEIIDFLQAAPHYDQGNGIEVTDFADLVTDAHDHFVPRPLAIQNTGWAVFAPSGAVVWKSFETSREASLRAYLGQYNTMAEALWKDAEKVGWSVREIEWVPVVR